MRHTAAKLDVPDASERRQILLSGLQADMVLGADVNDETGGAVPFIEALVNELTAYGFDSSAPELGQSEEIVNVSFSGFQHNSTVDLPG